MSRWRRFRKLAFRVAGSFLLFALVALVTLPYWMGSALQILAPKDMVAIGDYETLGYGRFRLSDVTIKTDALDLQLDRLEAPTPLNWAYLAATSGFEEFVIVAGNASVHLRENASDDSPTESESPRDVFEALEQVKVPLGLAQIWVPSSRVEKVALNVSGQTLEFRDIVWSDLSLKLEAIHQDYPEHPRDYPGGDWI